MDSTKSDEVAKQPIIYTRLTWVDVQDLVEGHQRALEIQEAGAERIINSAGLFLSVVILKRSLEVARLRRCSEFT